VRCCSRWCLAALFGVLAPAYVLADGIANEDEDHIAGSGSLAVFYQTIEVNEFNNNKTEVDIGEVLTHSVYLEGSYAITDRWLVSVGIPWIKKKYNGPARHDPLALDTPRPDVEFIDDGRYHDEWQDFVLGLNYLWRDAPVIIEPFFNLIIPSHSYPFFGQAAVGQDVWKAEFGADVTKYMPFSDWFYRGSLSYTVVEKTLGVNVNHFRGRAEAGYFFTPNLNVSAFLLGKLGNGKDATDFAPSVVQDEAWYQHDRTMRHEYLNAGAGVEWYIDDGYMLNVSALTTVWGRSVHMVDLAWTVGVTHYF
jgi:hypothetical protein